MLGGVMEIEKLIFALEETIVFLRRSQSSVWANLSTDEIIQELKSEITKAKNSQPNDVQLLASLFAPTGAIQETSIDNSWGDDFLRISGIVDHFTTDR
jgi:hypothetical protein